MGSNNIPDEDILTVYGCLCDVARTHEPYRDKLKTFWNSSGSTPVGSLTGEG